MRFQKGRSLTDEAELRPAPSGHRFWSIRALTDVGLAVLMGTAALLLIIVAAKNLRRPSTPTPSARVLLPADPIAFTGAAMKGAAGAPFVLIIYSDFQCPFCARLAREVLPDVERRFVGTGKLRLAFRHMPLVTIHPFATGAAEAAECAGAQGQFWPMHDLIFSDQARLGQSEYRTYAADLRLDSAAFGRCLGGEMAARVKADIAAARHLGVTGTPTMFLGRVMADGSAQVIDQFRGLPKAAEVASVIEKLVLTEGR